MRFHFDLGKNTVQTIQTLPFVHFQQKKQMSNRDVSVTDLWIYCPQRKLTDFMLEGFIGRKSSE